MSTPELTQYIQSELERGVNRDAIMQTLLDTGWSQEQINEAFASTQEARAPQPGEQAETKKKGMSGWVKALIALGVLVVLAPVTVIALVVFMSLGTARDRGIDAMVMSNIDQLRNETEIYASENNDSYLGACDSAALLEIFSSINEQSTANCFDSETAWAASATLNDGIFYCADRTGFTGKTAIELASGSTTCPAPIE